MWSFGFLVVFRCEFWSVTLPKQGVSLAVIILMYPSQVCSLCFDMYQNIKTKSIDLREAHRNNVRNKDCFDGKISFWTLYNSYFYYVTEVTEVTEVHSHAYLSP